MILRRLVLLAAIACSLSWSGLSLMAEGRSAADLLPPSTVVYVEMAEPGALLDVVLQHPLRSKLEAVEEIQKGLASPKFQQFQSVVKYVQQQIGMDWLTAVKTVTEGGIYLGLDAATEGVAVLLRSKDEAQLATLRERLVKLARDTAERQGKPDPLESVEYRGLTAYRANKAVFAQLGPWLMIANKSDLARAIADGYLDGSQASLAADSNYQAARATISGKPTVWAYLNVAALRQAGVARELFRDRHDNPAAELLLGGVLSTLAQTPYGTVALYVTKESVRLVASVAHDPAWTPEKRAYFFGPAGRGTAPAPLNLSQTLLSINAFRDIGSFWLAKEDLFDEKAAAQLAQADSQFSTLFAGLDFGQEVLAAVRPQIQIVAARQSYEHPELPEPDIKLPASAIIFRLKDAEKVRRRFKVAFQSLIGFVNVTGAQKGQPQLELETQRRGEAEIVSASYVPPEDRQEGLINYNFSPTLAFVGDRLIISSTSGLAGQLVDLASAQQAPAGHENMTVNTSVGLDLRVLGQLLQDNRKHLVARTMLRKGETQEAAEKRVSTSLDLLSAGKSLWLRLLSSPESLQLQLQLDWAS